MKLKNLFYAFALCCTFSFAACSDDDAPATPDNGSKKVPESVLQAFQKDYAGVKDVQWRQVKNYHVAYFNAPSGTRASVQLHAYSHTAWYTHDGKHCQTNEEISSDRLPVEVKGALKAYLEITYPGWKVDDCKIVVRADMELIYVIEIEKGSEERLISISSLGDILKDILEEDDNDDADDDDEFDEDLDDVLPVLVPEQIKAALQKLFPDNFQLVQIVEIEIDDDEIEVDVLVNGKHHEIEFSLDYKWISTQIKSNMEEALNFLEAKHQEVLAKIEAFAEKHHIDLRDPANWPHIDVEFEDHFELGMGIHFEIKIGKLELEFHVDANGKISLHE